MAFHHDAFLLYCEGLSVKEISNKLGKSENTVNSWRQRESWTKKKKERDLRLEEVAFEERAKYQREIVNTICFSITEQSNLLKKLVEDFKADGNKIDEQKWNAEDLKTITYISSKVVESFRKLFPEVDKEMFKRLAEEVMNNKNGNKS